MDALFRRARAHSNKVAFFPVSAVGATGSIERSGRTTIVPAKDLTPTGYEPLLRWILSRHRWRKNRVRRLLAASAAVVVVLFLAAAGLWWFYERLRINQILDDPGRSRIEKIELSTNVRLSAMTSSKRGANSFGKKSNT